MNYSPKPGTNMSLVCLSMAGGEAMRVLGLTTGTEVIRETWKPEACRLAATATPLLLPLLFWDSLTLEPSMAFNSLQSSCLCLQSAGVPHAPPCPENTDLRVALPVMNTIHVSPTHTGWHNPTRQAGVPIRTEEDRSWSKLSSWAVSVGVHKEPVVSQVWILWVGFCKKLSFTPSIYFPKIPTKKKKSPFYCRQEEEEEK